ncbi:MAG: hypothetical protein VXV98_09075, partial [Candidatus Thermoplasmatota archaeon]|nr:hypothetical protein [Candidatus Thermoplasmatota archaeon]
GTGDPTTQSAYSPAWVDLGVGRTALAISAGSDHTCAILDDSSLTCFGSDYNGALGNGPGQGDSSVPAIVLGGFTWSDSTGSNSGSSAFDLTSSSEGADLTVGEAMEDITFQYDAGAASGSGGGSSSSSAFAYANNKVSAKNQHTCAILDNGDLKCWGYDYYGQLGDGGGNTNAYAPSSTAIDLGTGRTAVAVSAGMNHTCAILDNGSLKCWGQSNYGKLGNSGISGSQQSPVAVSGSNTWDSSTGLSSGSGSGSSSSSSFAYANNKVSAGGKHTCAILGNGTLMCWGGDEAGQVGNGGANTGMHSTPVSVDVGTGRTALAVSAGYDHTCAILDNGNLSCWGSDSYGGLGVGGTVYGYEVSPTPVDLGTGRTAVAVSAGNKFTCAILDNGDLKCWGLDSRGQLGDGGGFTNTNAPSSTAIDLGTGRTAVAVSTGWEHACAILDNGILKCWGDDNFGTLGDGPSSTTYTDAPSSTPIDLGTGRTAVAVSAGGDHTCAILDNGDLKCWGRDNEGQLGDGGTTHTSTTLTTEPSSTPIDLGTGRTAVAVSASLMSHSCAILDNGE